MTAFVIAEPAIAAAFLSGRKVEMRVLARGPLAAVASGDSIRVRESCIPARIVGGKLHATARNRADLVVFADGWRQYRDGSHERGRPPTDSYDQWLGAMLMPIWAARLTLVVAWVRPGRLQPMTRADARAEGVLPSLGAYCGVGRRRSVAGISTPATHSVRIGTCFMLRPIAGRTTPRS